MRKNVASQYVAFQMNSSTDGSPVTSGTPAVYYTIDGGTQGTGGGVATHEGNGQWSYSPLQAETNGDHVAFTMILSGAIAQTVNVWPVSFDPTDSVRAGLTSLPNAAAGAAGGLPTDSAGKTSFNDLSAAQVNAECDTALADYDAVVPADLPTNFGDLSITATTGRVDVAAIAGTAQTANDNGADINAILSDTNELQADWANGGRLDLIIDAILADTGTDGVAISATVANQIADAILNRDMSAVSDTNSRSMLNALRILRNKYSISGTTLSVMAEDDSTVAWTATVTTDATAEPITGSDPT